VVGKLVGEDAMLTAEDLQKPKWQRVFYHGLARMFPTYGDLGPKEKDDGATA